MRIVPSRIATGHQARGQLSAGRLALLRGVAGYASGLTLLGVAVNAAQGIRVERENPFS